MSQEACNLRDNAVGATHSFLDQIFKPYDDISCAISPEISSQGPVVIIEIV